MVGNVVDSSGWLEYLGDGSNASVFVDVIADRTHLIVPTISVFEVVKVVRRLRGDKLADEAAVLMLSGQVIDLDAALALHAAQLSIEHRLPMADSIILATARRFDATLWTQDVDFAGIEDVRYLPKVA
ncbi:MAG: type II toxin-antitoxin system VapC family toxin [Janthinobacterium lividum]